MKMRTLSCLIFLQLARCDFPTLHKLKKLDIRRIDGMCRARQVPIRINYQGTKSEGNVLWFNITTMISENINGKSKVLVKVYRCSSRESLDSCQDYLHTHFNFCQMLDMSSLTPFYINYVPKLKCPFQKGTYRAINSKMDLTPIIALPLEKWYWKIMVDIFGEEERLLSCIIIEAYSVPDLSN